MNTETEILESKYLSIEYAMLVPYLVATVQELNKRISTLEQN